MDCVWVVIGASIEELYYRSLYVVVVLLRDFYRMNPPDRSTLYTNTHKRRTETRASTGEQKGTSLFNKLRSIDSQRKQDEK